MEMPLAALTKSYSHKGARLTPVAVVLLFLPLLNYCSPNTPEPKATPEIEIQTSIILETNQTLANFQIETAMLIRQLAGEYMQQIEIDFKDLGSKISSLQATISELVASPSAELLGIAQEHWLAAHLSFQQNRIHFKFLSAIANEDQSAELAKLVYQIDQWPILAGYIDSVSGYPKGGIVHDVNIDLTPESLIQQHGLFDTSEATLGFHVLEFLLWGEPGIGSTNNRHEDFEPLNELTDIERESGMTVNQLGNNRRRHLLNLVSTILTEDFRSASVIRAEASSEFISTVEDQNSAIILNSLLNSVTSVLSEEILARSLYKLLNDDLENALHSPYSQTSEMVVASQLQSVEKLLLETPTSEGVTLDQLLVDLSPNFEEFFYQNLDASKACLVLLYGSLGDSDQAVEESSSEFEVVECINLLTNLIDQFEQIKLNLPVTTTAI